MPNTIKKPISKKTATKKSVVRDSKVVAKKSVKVLDPQPKIKESHVKKGSVNIMNIKGDVVETMVLPKELTEKPFNKALVAQAMRVYLANQHTSAAKTKTRGEVEGSTRKIYRQKGTGRARHGGIRAPIFVGGGIAFGPVTHSFTLHMPTKAKQAALFSSFGEKIRQNDIRVVDSFESLDLKTKLFAQMLKLVGVKGRTLFVTGEKTKLSIRAMRNIKDMHILPIHSVTTYDIVANKTILFTKDDFKTMLQRLTL